MPPKAQYRLPNRAAGSFGLSPLGQVAEWITSRWITFDLFVAWAAVILISASQFTHDPTLSLLLILTSPVGALALYVATKILISITWFIPLVGPIVGIVRLTYIWTFCRIIVEPSPQIEISLWRR